MKHFIQYIKFLLTLFGIALLFTFILRAANLISNFSLLSEEGANDSVLWLKAFIRGVWFDTVVSCYILIAPLILSFILSFIKPFRWFTKFIAIFLSTFYSLVFAASAANIAYFGYFFKNINSSIFQWSDEATTNIGMMFSEASFVPPIILGFAAIIAYWIIALKAEKKLFEAIQKYKTDSIWQTVLAGVVLIPLCVFGTRGRMGYQSIKVSGAYFCNDPFLNQLGVSPMFNLIASTLDSRKPSNQKLKLMADDEAIAKVKEYFNITAENAVPHKSPLCRTVSPDSAILSNPNIVLVLMESMSSDLLGVFGNEKKMTPFLDSLSKESIFFDNVYSAGNHTNQGIYSTLYSKPTILFRNAMKSAVVPVIEGLPTVLKQQGYSTYFYMTHESQYDNMNAYLRTNGFDNIRSQEDYPRDKVVNHYGVPDDFLFDYALGELLPKQDTAPFFATLLTISNHPPYRIPKDFKTKNEESEWAIVEFADHCLRNFFEKFKQHPKFKNTLFVFIGDHGKIVGTPECEIPLSYNRVPMFIYYEGCEPRTISNLACQCDVMPTILGLIGQKYEYEGFGIDLLREKRSEVVFSADNALAAVDSTHLYIYMPASKEEHVYKMEKRKLLGKDDIQSVDALKNYMYFTIQAAESVMQK